MARPLRIEAAGLTYHVWARGVRKMEIYLDDPDREQFLTLLGEAFVSHEVDCHAYCLMSNHYHLVITTNKANLSHAIKQVDSPYAQWWNDRHSRSGHVFQGRFGAQVIQDEQYLLTACRYIVLNPIRAGLVTSPEQWRWSSYRATAGLVSVPEFLHPDMLWHRLGGGDAGVTWHRYRNFVVRGDAAVARLDLPRGPVLGDEAFVRRFDDRRRLASTEVPKRDRTTRPPLTTLFAGAFAPADRAAAASAARAAGYSLKEIATLLGTHYTTVCKMISRAGPAMGSPSPAASPEDVTPGG